MDNPQSNPHSAILNPIRSRQSTIRSPIRNRQWTSRNPQSPIPNRQSASPPLQLLAQHVEVSAVGGAHKTERPIGTTDLDDVSGL
jgi:hypothetical protein